MRIGMILDRPFPPDDRVEKEARSLLAAGFDVHLLCFRFGKEPDEEDYKGIKVKRVFMPCWLFKKLSALILLVPFYNWFWSYHLNKYIRQSGIEVLHVHDLPLSGLGVKIKKRLQIPIIIDMHEDWADWIVSAEHYNTFLGRIIKKLSKWKKYEKKCLRNADKIIGVSEPLIQKMVTEHNLQPSKMVLIPNTPDLNVFLKPQIYENYCFFFKDKFNIIYAGGIDYLRGLQNILPDIKELSKTIQNIQLVIIGDGSYKKKLQEQIELLKIQKFVTFTGWLSIEKLAAYLNLADIGIYPQLTYGGIEYTLPTKLYQYCAAGLPVIANDHSLPKEFLEKNGCGFVVNFEENENDFKEKIIYLYRHDDVRHEMGARGKAAIISRYNWGKTVAPLINMYRLLQN